MRDTPPHLKVIEEIEREDIPGLVEVLREEGLDAGRYVRISRVSKGYLE